MRAVRRRRETVTTKLQMNYRRLHKRQDRRLRIRLKAWDEMERQPQSDIFRKHGYAGLHKPGSGKRAR
jgi:hypothetical protein